MKTLVENVGSCSNVKLVWRVGRSQEVARRKLVGIDREFFYLSEPEVGGGCVWNHFSLPRGWSIESLRDDHRLAN